MDRAFLSRLYWACVAPDKWYEDGCNLSELYQRTEEAAKADAEFSSFVDTLNLDRKTGDEHTNYLSSLIVYTERQGFINGFRLAMTMMLELG